MAVAASTSRFAGFRPEAIQFLADLAEHNDRAWFQPRKADYERLLKEPLEGLVGALAERFEARGLPLLADPRRSIFRIYRDTRFARDKSPYKTNVGASFPWLERAAGSDVPDERAHGNGGYFHFQPGQMYVGGGMWHPDKERLDAFRRAVVERPDEVATALDEPGFVATFGAVNSDQEPLKRVPAGYPPDHPRADLLKLRDIVFGRRLGDEEVLSSELPDILTEAFAAAMPVLRFMSTLRT